MRRIKTKEGILIEFENEQDATDYENGNYKCYNCKKVDVKEFGNYCDPCETKIVDYYEGINGE